MKEFANELDTEEGKMEVFHTAIGESWNYEGWS